MLGRHAHTCDIICQHVTFLGKGGLGGRRGGDIGLTIDRTISTEPQMRRGWLSQVMS